MKILRFFLCIAIFSIGFCNSAFTQLALNHQETQKVKENLNIYKQKLRLSPQKQKQFENVTWYYAKRMKPLRNGKGSVFYRYKKYKKMEQEKNQKMRSILTTTQYQRYIATQKLIIKRVRKEWFSNVI